jgi:hypothetical protein
MDTPFQIKGKIKNQQINHFTKENALNLSTGIFLSNYKIKELQRFIKN